MQLLEAIRGRRAVRDFRPEPLSAGVIFQLITAAAWAPSAMNAQPWHFTVVTDRAVLDEIAGRAREWMRTNAAAAHGAQIRGMLDDPHYHILHHAPALIVISAPAGPWAREDCAMAAQNLMLQAAALGLGSCWIGLAQDWLNTPAGREILNLPQESLVVAPIIVGHPRNIPQPVPRRKPAVNWIGQHPVPAEPEATVTLPAGFYGALIHP